ncbi:unnamed protein product [Heligmosomoides polygyrus]|uniref:FAD_binding_3 domain-containing protein n=1 Tax=Heligmosomoides polygyrus TaxID=6339 RepID=A0A183G6F6_HELPZ|nr:unnamed protein product [Heligmosomoides polygyrus]
MRRHDQADLPVIIIGNGPAGLSLSAFLSGVLPFYNPNKPHPDPLMNQKLLENLDQSLLDQRVSLGDSTVISVYRRRNASGLCLSFLRIDEIHRLVPRTGRFTTQAVIFMEISLERDVSLD